LSSRNNAVLRDKGHDVGDLGMDQRFAAGNRNIVGVAPFLEEEDFFLDLVQGLVAGHMLPVAPFAVDVTFVRDLQPGNGVVVHGPRQPIQFVFFERHLDLLCSYIYNEEKECLLKTQMPQIVSDNPKLGKSPREPAARLRVDALELRRGYSLQSVGGFFDRTASLE
jgi:hypothetical protein